MERDVGVNDLSLDKAIEIEIKGYVVNKYLETCCRKICEE
jgi:hypothetical protein